MASQVMRITLKAYDHKLIDQSAGKIIETVKKSIYYNMKKLFCNLFLFPFFKTCHF